MKDMVGSMFIFSSQIFVALLHITIIVIMAWWNRSGWDSSSWDGWQRGDSAWRDWRSNEWEKNDWEKNEWEKDWEKDWEPSDNDKADENKELKYTWLGGSKKAALPLTQQSQLLQRVMQGHVGAVRLSQWRGATMQAAWFLLCRVDASATSLGSLGGTEPWLWLR